MSIKLGNTDINKIYLGPTEIKKTYLGSTLIYDKTAPTNGLLNNLVSYYKMDTSGSFPDAHGSNNGTINGASYTASGKINGGYSFDGSNDFIDLNTNFIPSGQQSYYSFWVYPTDLSGGDTFSTSNPRNILGQNSSSSPFIRLLGTRLNVGVYNGSYLETRTTQSFTTGEWQFVEVLITPSSTTKVWRNGVLLSNDTNATFPATWTNGTQDIGRNSFTGNIRHYNGVLDEMGIWNNFNPTDIQRNQLYNSGAGLSYDDFTT